MKIGFLDENITLSKSISEDRKQNYSIHIIEKRL